MCGRYKLQELGLLEADFEGDLARLADSVRRPRYNVAPGQLVLSLRREGSAQHLEQMRWGIEAPWSERGGSVINARAEKLTSSRLWSGMLEDGRCALPADGFYEWLKSPAGSRRRPFLFGRNEDAGFWLAGLAAPAEDAQAARACVVITVAPNELVAGVHDRMPAMLRGEQLENWLGSDVEAALAELASFPSLEMSAREVGPAVGSAANEGPQLVAPLQPAQGSLLD